MRSSWLLLGLSLYAIPLWAHPEDPIITDRPSFSNSSVTVGKGIFQVETGVGQTVNRDPSGTRSMTTQIPVLLRLGLRPSLEARLGTNGYTWQRTGHDRSEGLSDITLGFKWHARDQAGYCPAIGVLVTGEPDSGARPIRGNGFQPTLQLPLDWSLPRGNSLTIMPGVTEADNTLGRFTSGMIGVVANQGWTTRFQTFVEWAAQQWAAPRHGGIVQSLDVGATFLITPNIQLDGALWRGLNRQSADLFWTVGLSFRI